VGKPILCLHRRMHRPWVTLGLPPPPHLLYKGGGGLNPGSTRPAMWALFGTARNHRCDMGSGSALNSTLSFSTIFNAVNEEETIFYTLGPIFGCCKVLCRKCPRYIITYDGIPVHHF
jgi:hypothetical protein